MYIVDTNVLFLFFSQNEAAVASWLLLLLVSSLYGEYHGSNGRKLLRERMIEVRVNK